MSAFELAESEIKDILASEKVVRVAFSEASSTYLIPLGFVWLHSALHGITEFGKKTQCAKENSHVAFQVDTSAETGIFQWRSVSGEGEFEIVADDELRGEVFKAFGPMMAQAPNWWILEQGPKVSSGSLQVWRIRPTRISGRGFGPASDKP